MQKRLFFGGGRRRWRCLPGPPLNHSRPNPKLKLQHYAPTRPTRPARPDAKKTAMQTKLQCNKNVCFGRSGWRCLPGPPLNHSRPDPNQHYAQTRPARPDARPARPDANKNCSAKKTAMQNKTAMQQNLQSNKTTALRWSSLAPDHWPSPKPLSPES